MAAPTIDALNVTENYDALKILREEDLNSMVSSIETYSNENLRLNIVQFATDVFGDYAFNNDGIATYPTPLVDLLATLSENETIAGAWTFTGITTFSNKVSSSSSFTSTGQPRARAYLSGANQSIADITITSILFNAETYDVGAMHDNVTNSNLFTIPAGEGGLYSFVAQVNFAANSTGRREVYIYKNGVEIAESKEFAPSASETTTLQVCAQDAASAGDVYDVRVYQNSTGALDVTLGQFVSFFSGTKVW